MKSMQLQQQSGIIHIMRLMWWKIVMDDWNVDENH